MREKVEVNKRTKIRKKRNRKSEGSVGEEE